MINAELIDDYLSNRLQERDRTAFELQMEGDPSLKEEVEFQKKVVEGVRKARAAELKTMLNNVPLNGNSWSSGQITAGILSVGLVATLLYFYLNEDPQTATTIETPKQEILITPDNSSKETITTSELQTKEEVSATALETGKNKPEVVNENNIMKPVTKPDIQPVDPSGEFSETKPNEAVNPGHSEISVSKMEVITGLSDKKHNFHYQFAQGKLMLYGPFDKSLYEILEINGEGHAVFLYYKENYYLLDEKQAEITVLQPIRDGQLLKKLKEYRGR